MSKLKRTTEDVAAYFKEQGCELLDEYTGSTSQMDYKCSCGRYGTTTWNNFSKGRRCGSCKKRSISEVAVYFKEQGCELLGEYHGCMKPMDYRCSCGTLSVTTWNNFSRGKRCGQCAKNGMSKKRSVEEVKAIFADRGCEFLDNEFRGIHFKHNFRCKCGRIAQITLAGFHHQGQDCKQCGLEKLRGSKHPGWKADREKHRLDQLFRKKCYKALSSSLKATGKKKVGRTSDMLGYTPKQLQEHVESHPDWDQLKDTNWHLDHIFPIQAFLDHGISDMSVINHLTNLRPTSQAYNNQKWAHYNLKEFETWLSEKGLKVNAF